MSLFCEECSREFSVKSNLTRHLRMVHNIEVERIDILPADFNVYHYKCLEGCKISFKYNRELRKHLRNKHRINQVELNLEFPNSEEFNKWLQQEESSNYVQYVHLTATKRRSTGTETYYYECSRTGKRSYLDENIRKRKPRKWIAKLNHGCTSQIIVNKSYDGTYSINYFKTHYGHEIGLEHLKLSKQDRGSVASKLLLGLPISTVLDSVKSPQSTLKRINLLAHTDVFNICKSYNIDLRDGKLVNIDAINITAFLSDCAGHPHNPVLHCNLQEFPESGYICFALMTKHQAEMLKEGGDNVVAVISTPLNHCDFDLVTLFVIDKNKDCFPAACMFTTKTDSAIYELFFSRVQQRVGRLIPDTFVSNCDEMYYKAWRTVMGEADLHIYNPVQVDLDWKLNLNKILCSETDVTRAKRKWVFEALKSLQNNSDENDFLESLEATVKVLKEDEDFADFLDYFMKNYSDHRKWAVCYRSGCNLPLAQLEVIGDLLRQYLNEVDEKRFDKIFHSLIRYVRDESVNSMLKTKKSRGIFIAQNDRRHQALATRRFNGNHVDDRLWNVSDDELEMTFIVQKYLERRCCNLICSTCHICLHCFSCTCVDFFISNAICEHIHYVWMTYFQSIMEEDCEEETENCDEEIIIAVDEEQEAGNNAEFLRNEILARTTMLTESIERVRSENRLRVILETVNQLCEFVASKNEETKKKGKEVNKDFLDDHSYL